MAGNERYAAFMRGINVGGKNKLPMAELRVIFEEVGCANVASYIQSGNVAFDAPGALAAQVHEAVADGVEARFGFRVPVVVRSAPELRAVVDGNPFLEDGADTKALHVAFLAEVPSDEGVASLEPDRSPPDRFEVHGRDVYLHCPGGMGRSKLTNAWFDSRLGTVSTMRNWRTVLKMLDMTGG